MSFVEIRAGKLYYAQQGEGSPVIFLHGAGSSHLIWGAQLRALGESARVIALDLPGHGKSGGSGLDAIDGYSDAVAAFLDALAIERAVVIGHSMGGAIAQTLALSHPERVCALGLVATGARLRVRPDLLKSESGFESALRLVTQEGFAPGADAALIEKAAAQLRACDPRLVRGDYAACDAFDVMDRVAAIRAPTLVVCGRQDQMTPPKYSEFLASKIPNARLEWIEGAGHHVMIEQPEAVNRAIVEFVRKVDSPSHAKN